eukprot:CAMPEP_0204443172 /NCGR_PEP_ID=MMETSP0470-20130426/88596_1 /ASSEMBLY_ACC=CAM_ASM_000385 /TAXON_ID=2969 /ORGANISM="Oxyrrhis marina" /LENGTH=55 /DNA_ID=CAMNT_0051442447 /DNA_START=1 /DNA_END=165 /DNA_ORIENTATION=+
MPLGNDVTGAQHGSKNSPTPRRKRNENVGKIICTNNADKKDQESRSGPTSQRGTL